MTGWNIRARLWADFNDIYRDNLLELDLDFAVSPDERALILQSGDWVRIWDGEGNECSAIVESIDGAIAATKLDLASWTSVNVEIISKPTPAVGFHSRFAPITSSAVASMS